jgi:hypothetical protein
MPVTKVSAGESAVFFESSSEDRQVLAEVVAAATGSAAAEVSRPLEDLAEHEKDLLAWIDRSPENARLFLEEPLEAVEKADLGIGGEALARLRDVAKAVEGSFAADSPTASADGQGGAAAVAGKPSLQLQGWDLVAASTQRALNSALAQLFAEGAIQKAFTETVESKVLGKITVTVNVGAPSIDLNPAAAKGQRGLVGITFPIESGSIKGQTEIAIPPGRLEVVTALSYVDVEGKEEGRIERLALDFTSEKTVCEVVIEEQGWDPAWSKLLGEGLATYLRGQTPGAFYLGEVEVAKEATPIAPAGGSDFAVQVGPEPAENVLLLLMLSPSGKAGNPDFGSAPSLVPAGQQAAFYLSNRLLIDKVVAPALAKGLEVPESSFGLSGSSTELCAARFSGRKSLSGDYEPELTGLELEVNGNGQIQSAYTVAAHPGFNLGETYYFKVTGNIFVTPVLDVGTQALTFKTEADEGSAKIECSVAGWIIIGAAILFSFGTLGALVAIVLAVVVPIVITQLRFPVSLPSSLLKHLETSIGSVRWPAQKDFPLNAVELPGDLVFIGEPTF